MRGKGLAIITAGLVFLTSAGCSELASESMPHDAGPLGSFWVELNILDQQITENYKPVRVMAMMDVEDEGLFQIGVAAVYPTGKYKITLPKLYEDRTDFMCVVEFTKKNSAFDDEKYKNLGNLIISFLKSRYYEGDFTIPQLSAAPTKTIKIKDISDLGFGYGPGGLTLENIPGTPFLYFLNIDESEIEESGFTATYAIATDDDSPPTLENISNILNSEYGFASTETDWIMLFAPEYEPGGTLYLWVKVERATGSACCPCGASCDSCAGCSCSSQYTLFGELWSLTGMSVNTSGLPTGSSITIPLLEGLFCDGDCAEG
ncbi:MAG: hypothetical protein LBD86_04615 [Spirochaetaceae bacterium]|nr:hypothetical protein [Spirochaetaceae bacterium]